MIIAFSLVLILALVLANKDRPEYTTTRETGVEYETAKVLAITEDNSEVDRDTEGVLRGSAELKVEILTGRYKGDICFVTNYFSALYNVNVKPGDTVCVRIDTTGDGIYCCNILYALSSFGSFASGLRYFSYINLSRQ